ncbi:MAG: S41 family peptidase [Bacteroidota bacterium]
MIKITIILCCCMGFSFLQTHEFLVDDRCAERLSVAELQEDFSFFKERLIRYHPGLYTYATQTQIDSAFTAIESQLEQPMDDLAFYQLLSPLKSLIKDGHTYFYPNQQTRDAISEKSALPIDLFWDWENLWVKEVYNATNEVQKGDKVLSINGLNAAKVVEKLMTNIIRDGRADSYPRWIMNHWFNEIYHLHFPIPVQWDLVVEDKEGKEKRIVLANQPRPSVPEQGAKPKGISLYNVGEVTVLKVASFNNSLLKKRYGQKFRLAIKAAFQSILANGTNKLILDLRDNQGGEIDNGRYLLSFLLEERFAIVRSLKKVVAPEQDIDQARLAYKRFSNNGWTKPQALLYDGELLVLINGGSFSCSGAVAAQIEAAKRAILLGEESGGNSRTFCGVGPQEYLPHSKISLSVPRVQFQVVDGSENLGLGVIPDHYAVPSIIDLVQGRDAVLEKAVTLFEGP